MTDLTPEALSSLEQLARGATPGPWTVNPDLRYVAAPDGTSVMDEMDGTDATVYFVAAASPGVVLSLLEEIKRLRAFARQHVYHVASCVWFRDGGESECSCGAVERAS